MHRCAVHRTVTSLLSHHYRLASSDTLQPANKWSLPTNSERPSLFRRQANAEAVDLRQYGPAEVAGRLATFTPADWSRYLSLVGHYRMGGGRLLPFGLEQLKLFDKVKKSLFEWLSGNMESVQPVDYFNLLRSLDAFNEFDRLTKRRAKTLGLQQALPSNAHDIIFQWLMKNYDKLDRHSFFQILNRKLMHIMQHDVVGMESQEDVLKIIKHGVELASKEAEVVNILHLLYTIELYSGFYSDPRFGENSQRLLTFLSAKTLPVDGFDLLHSLQFVSSQKKIGSYLSHRAVFHRYAKNSEAWNWLRNSIELVFGNEEYEDMRAIAAVAVVRAYKWKAIQFSPDDVEKYLKSAAEPFLSKPAAYFELPKNDVFRSRKTALSYLILALRSAALSDLANKGKVAVKLDNAYWNKFFDVAEKEAPKMGERAVMLRDLKRLKINQPLSKEEKRFVSDPLGQGRAERLQNLLKQKYHLSGAPANQESH